VEASGKGAGSLTTASVSKSFFLKQKLIKHYYSSQGSLKTGLTPQALALIEERLDVLVFRTGIPQSIFHARNLIRHGQVLVDHKLNRNLFSRPLIGSRISFRSPASCPPRIPATHLVSINPLEFVYVRRVFGEHVRLPANLV
jgi:hypothetical protein